MSRVRQLIHKIHRRGPWQAPWAAMPSVVLTAVVASGAELEAQQVTETDYQPVVENPAYGGGAGPLVLVDEGHNNFHTISPSLIPHSDDTTPGRLTVFRNLVTTDGYRVEPLADKLSPESLARASILVIANALADANVDTWALPNPSALEAEEIRVVVDWVTDGGALLLIADHQPWAGAAAELAFALGMIFTNGYADDRNPDTEWEMFTLEDRSLLDHPIVRGRSAAERVRSVMTFGGQAFRPVPGVEVEPLMVFPPGSEVVFLQDPFEPEPPPETVPTIRADGLLEGAVRTVGSGRVAVFGEAAMFTAQVTGADRRPMGLNHPDAGDNAQFVLNVMHWLSGLLDAR